ncbi:uncharacterized protein LOC132731454, partial [Ruditapes philippinarum]|uniref:uncharacterized protein LOC132731454 n=1 Tax=Ruditapes philippinarum TaxID=129788 RepID=UPI00295B8D2F
VNAVSPKEKRTVEDCKKKWLCAVSLVKKEEAKRRSEACGTGGGQPPLNLPLWQEIILSTIPHCAVSGISGGLDSGNAIEKDADQNVRVGRPGPSDEGTNTVGNVTDVICNHSITGNPDESVPKGQSKKRDDSVPKGQSKKRVCDVDLASRMVEIEEKKLKVAEECLRVKDEKKKLLFESVQLQKRSTEALETIASILQKQDFTSTFFET